MEPEQSTRAARRLVIGLTGNIACGKSTVSGILTELGAAVVDADQVAHQALEAGTATAAEVLRAFGRTILNTEGQIDRRALGGIVFSDPAALRRLEAIVHPFVRKRMSEFVERSTGIVVIDAIKLIESPLRTLCDVIWVVTCSERAEIARLVQRNGYSREEALLRLRAQGPQALKIAAADTLIENAGSLEELRSRVLAAWSALPSVE